MSPRATSPFHTLSWLVFTAVLGACSPPATQVCALGESRLCMGALTSCQGTQLCLADRSGFDTCICGAAGGGNGGGGGGGGGLGGGSGGSSGDSGVDAGFDAGHDAGHDAGSDAGVDAGSTDAGVDAGTDAGAGPCASDFDCGSRQICNRTTGVCSAGQSCSADFQCQSLDPQDRCFRFGQQCTCDTTASGGGVCRLRRGPCEECNSDLECGADVVIFGPPDGVGAGRCRTLPNDPSGRKYCRYQRVGQCACGTIDDGTGFCQPASSSCVSAGCNLDRECPSGAVCTVNLPPSSTCAGVCVPRCRWDFSSQANVVPGCPPGTTCWVDSANLDPNAVFYGAGRCKAPCTSPTDCQLSGTNAFGGSNLTCRAEQLPSGGQSAQRCRANGACMDDLECPALAPGQPNLGYCDRATFACRSDCRTGLDPITGAPYRDCRPPYACASDAGVNFCRLESCHDQGGAGIACSRGQYCCGDDKDFDGVADPCPPAAQQDSMGCYTAPSPPFCTQCAAATPFNTPPSAMTQAQADQECASLPMPAWALCPDGGASPNCSPLKPSCRYAGDRGASTGLNICLWPTVNDIGSVDLMFGPTPKMQLACPANSLVQFVRPQPNPNGAGTCQTNADCNRLPDGGLGTAGTCELDPAYRAADGGLLKSCRCDAKSGATQCPAGSFCKDAVTGSRSFCIETALCVPPAGSVYAPTNQFGCGL